MVQLSVAVPARAELQMRPPRRLLLAADRGRQPDVVAFQTLRPHLVLLDGGAGVVAPVAFRDLARLADTDCHPYRAVAAACVHRDQDRQPQLGVVLDLDSQRRASPASWSASWSVPSACLLARPFITLKPTTIKAILQDKWFILNFPENSSRRCTLT
jgi:hypothetical protein